MNLNNKELMLMHILALSAARCHCRRRAARASKPNKFRTKNKAEKLWCGYKLRLSNYAYRIVCELNLNFARFFRLIKPGQQPGKCKHQLFDYYYYYLKIIAVEQSEMTKITLTSNSKI